MVDKMVAICACASKLSLHIRKEEIGTMRVNQFTDCGIKLQEEDTVKVDQFMDLVRRSDQKINVILMQPLLHSKPKGPF